MTKEERKKKNTEYIKKCEKGYSEEIRDSVNNSSIYNKNSFDFVTIHKNIDCYSLAKQIKIDKLRKDITILNFASYTNPGGGFANGAIAQEESLCGDSLLYNILNNKKFYDFYEYNNDHKNKGCYENRAIFTPEVEFKDQINFNVLTLAAPNANVMRKNGFSEKQIVDTYRNRLIYMYKILHKHNQNILIAGAWGCGVFGFDQKISEKLFKEVAIIETKLAYL